MKENEPIYMRVGTTYYKRSPQRLLSGDYLYIIRLWSRAAINDDLSAEDRRQIPKFDSFVTIPDHINYTRTYEFEDSNGEEVNKHFYGSYNLYEPLNYPPEQGTWMTTRTFLEHIFGDQFAIGLDFLTLLFQKPTQLLPILCLVSSKRSTGKTTFLNWLKAIYGCNMTINTNQDFRNQFNSGWTSKLLIGVDEVLLDKVEDAERIKNYATTRSIKSEAKGKDKVEQEFFGKFILCSNNEDSFIHISRDEIRFWVRNIPSISNENPNLLEELINEIPAFLFELNTRSIQAKDSTRMWFTREELWTPALQKVIDGTESVVEKEIREIITETLIEYDLDKVYFTPKNLVEELLKDSPKLQVVKSEVKKILIRWGLEQVDKPTRYDRYFKVLDNDGNWHTKSESTSGYHSFLYGTFF